MRYLEDLGTVAKVFLFYRLYRESGHFWMCCSMMTMIEVARSLIDEAIVELPL